MIDVLVIESNAARRNGLATLIDGTPGYRCVSSFTNCVDILEQIEKFLPDVLLINNFSLEVIDIGMIEQIQKKLPDGNILILLEDINVDMISKVFRAGVCGCLRTKTPPAKLLEAIMEASVGGSPIDCHVAKKLLDSFQQKKQFANNNLSGLTNRELEVLYSLSEGKSYREIGEDLFISVSTVRYHLQNTYRKLNVHTEAAAVAKAIRKGFI